MVLMVKGKAELVVINAAAFEAMQQDVNDRDGVENICAGLTQAAEGKLIPPDRAFAEIRENLRKGAKGAGWMLPPGRFPPSRNCPNAAIQRLSSKISV